MKKILFVCHGNICRSPMAEFMLKHMVNEAGKTDEFLIESAATTTEELGNDVYPPAKLKLKEHGIPFSPRKARQIRPEDYDEYDFIIGMDDENMRDLNRVYDNDPAGKIYKMFDFIQSDAEVSDPWYTGDFEATYRDLDICLKAFLSK